MTKAYSYLRFSTPEQMRGDSFRRQTAMANEYAARRGLELDDELTFHDLGVSAYRGKNAEAGRLADFLEAVKAGLVPRGSYLLVEGLDRISRLKPRRALKVLENIVDEGITLVTLNDGREYDTDSLDEDPLNLLLAVLTFIRANEESATKAARLRASWDAKRAASETKPLTALAPAWLRLKEDRTGFDIISDRADVVRRIFDMTLNGVGQHSIEKILNAEGVPVFGRGSQWHRSYILKILDNPAVVGTFTPHAVEYEDGKKVRRPLEPVKGYFPSVVSEDVFQRVLAVRKSVEPLRGRHAKAEISNILGGLAKCPNCGATMTRVSKNKAKGWVYLVCTKAKSKAGCQYKAVRYDAVEQAVLERGTDLFLDLPSSGASDLDNQLQSIEEHISDLSERGKNLLDELAMNPSPSIRDRVRTLDQEIEVARTERTAIKEMMAQSSGPLIAQRVERAKEALTATSVDRTTINRTLRELFSEVVVDYKTGFLELQWHHSNEPASLFYEWVDGD